MTGVNPQLAPDSAAPASPSHGPGREGAGRRSRLGPLIARSLGGARRAFAAALLILAAFQLLVVAIASSFQEARSFNFLASMMSMGVQQALGPGVLMLASFPGMVTFGYFHPAVVVAVLLLGAYTATEPAGEVEWGLFDLELARPIRRRVIVTRTVLVSFGATAAVVAAMLGGTWAGLALLAPAGAAWPEPARLISLGAHLLMLAWVFAAAGLAAAGWSRRRGTAFAVVAVAALFLDLLNVVADAWPPASRLQPWTPFHYFPGFAVANGTAPVGRDLTVLAVVAGALVALAYWRFERRDL